MSEDWLGVPLTSEGRTVGALVVQSYTKEFSYTEQDKELLATSASTSAPPSTARARSRRQRVAEQRYRGLVEELPLVVYTDKPDASGATAGIPVYISPRVEQIFGYPADAWLEEGFFESVLLSRGPGAHCFGRTRRPPRSGRRTLVPRVPRTGCRRPVVWIRDDAWIVRDEHGKPDAPPGLHDRHHQPRSRRLPSSIARSSTSSRSSRSARSPSSSMDRDERVTGWNPAAAELFGYSPEEAIGRLIEDLVLASEDLRRRRPGRHPTRLSRPVGRIESLGAAARTGRSSTSR